jgi:hypothetical protein
MSADYIDIGPSPAEETCQQIGAKDYDSRLARLECTTFIDQIRRTNGAEPNGARLIVKTNAHDFGSYLEVICKFDDDNETAMRYAYALESDSPATWDDTARAILAAYVPA